MNIFVDYHHDDLYYSLYLLLEKRLGHKLYRPIGMDWFDQGFWDIGNPYPNPRDTAKQYLGTDDRTWDAYKNLNGDYKIEDGIYYVYNPPNKFHHRGITLEKFKEMKFDIIISSFPFGHEQTYQRLQQSVMPSAKFIVQLGNIYQQTIAENVMCSTVPYPTDKNVIFYHQEFDLDIFKSVKRDQKAFTICNFVNIMLNKDLFEAVEKLVPEYFFKSFGAGNRDGTLTYKEDIAGYMQMSKFGWHIKPGGDGFGHIIHNWFAVGKPIITNISDYKDKLAGQLLVDGFTCIDVENKTPEEIAERIKYFSEPERYEAMCENVKTTFRNIVNFDREAEQVQGFLENLR